MWAPLAQSEAIKPERILAVIPEDFPPQYQLDKQGKPSGFAVEMLNAVAAKANLNIEYLVKPSWDEVFLAIENGEAILLPNVGISKYRETYLDFTIPIEQLPISIFVTSDNSSIHSIEDLFGKKVIAVKKNIAIQELKKHPSIDLMIVKDIADGFTPLLSHKVAAIIYPEPWVWARATEAGIADHLKIVGRPLMHVTRAMAVKKNNKALLNKLNENLEIYLASPQYKALEKRWKHTSKPVEISPSLIVMGTLCIGLLLAFCAIRLGLIQKTPFITHTSIGPITTEGSTESQKMSEHSRALLIISTIVVVIIGSVLSATSMFYQSAFESTRTQLIDSVKLHKSAIQALIMHEDNFIAKTSSKQHKSVLSEYIELIANTRTENPNQELELAKKNGENIEFFFSHHKSQTGKTKVVLFHSQNAEPMRLALQGKSGTVIGRDYKGELVLAAYESFDDRNLGLVEKINITAIRAPFIKSALYLSAVISLLVIIGSFLITRLGNPIIINLRNSLRELKRFEQKLRLHYNQHVVGMMTIDKNACISEWNIACEKIFGYAREEALKQQIDNLISQNISPHTMAHLWQELMDQSGGTHSITINNTKSGDLITCEWFNSSIVDIDGEVVGVSSIVLDITDKAAATKALKLDKERSQLLLNLVESTIDDEDDFIKKALQSSIQLTGSQIGYIHFLHNNEKTLFSITHNCSIKNNTPPKHTQLNSAKDILYWTGKIYLAKTVIQNNNANLKDYKELFEDQINIKCHMSVPITHGEKNVGIVGAANKDQPYTNEDVKQLRLYTQSMWNIIIHRRTQKKLIESQTHYRTLIESSAAIPWEMDIASYRFTYVGPQAVAVLGYPVEEWYKERFWSEHLHPEDAVAAMEYCQTATNRGEDHDFKYRMIAKNGSEVWILDYVKVVKVDGKPSSLRGFMFDITAHQYRENILRHTQKMDAIGTLTGGIAHDYNNMLGIIMGYSEMLAEQVADNPKLTKHVDRIYQAGKRGTQLTKKLLQFSKKSGAAAENCSINELLKDNEDMLAKTLTPKITLTLSLKEDLGQVYIDKGGLEDAILNLSINAMHAMPTGGKLEITTNNISLNSFEGKHYQLTEGSYVSVSVTDDGTGMDKTTQEKIFDPFFSTKGEKGTGLGMFQVYGLIHKAGGVIHIYSALDHGTRVSILLPRYYSSENDYVLQKTESDELLRGDEHILVVDDEPSLCQLAEDILLSKGYQIETAENAEIALEKLSKNHFDLLLSDIIMPKMDGYQLAHEVQKRHPKIKIQLTSGFDNHANIEARDKILQDHLIHKPYTSNALLTQIRNLLDAPDNA